MTDITRNKTSSANKNTMEMKNQETFGIISINGRTEQIMHAKFALLELNVGNGTHKVSEEHR